MFVQDFFISLVSILLLQRKIKGYVILHKLSTIHLLKIKNILKTGYVHTPWQKPMSKTLKLFCDSFGFLLLHKPLIVLEDLLCTSACQLLTKWGYSVSLSTVNFNNLLEGPLTVSFYHIINDDSIFLCHSISSTDPWPYYSPVMKCNGVVIGPHYTRSGNIRLIFLSQWALLVTLNEKPNTVSFLCRLSSK